MLDLTSILTRAKSLKIAVIGDLIEDIYIYGSVNRISPEAPVPVVEYHETKRTMGGAGNVFKNIQSLCPEVHLYCFFNGGMPWVEKNIWAQDNPHSRKTRIIANEHHQIVRVDEEKESNYNPIQWWSSLMNMIAHYDAIVLSDYGKGVLSENLIDAIISQSVSFKKTVIVDAKKDFYRFKGATVLKCNHKEWSAVDESYQEEMLTNGVVGAIIVTKGAHGMSWTQDTPFKFGDIPGLSIPIVDVCGAGDTVTAILAIMKALGEPIHDACCLANIAAAEVCKYSGVTPIDEDKLISAYKNYYGSANNLA